MLQTENILSSIWKEVKDQWSHLKSKHCQYRSFGKDIKLFPLLSSPFLFPFSLYFPLHLPLPFPIPFPFPFFPFPLSSLPFSSLSSSLSFAFLSFFFSNPPPVEYNGASYKCKASLKTHVRLFTCPTFNLYVGENIFPHPSHPQKDSPAVGFFHSKGSVHIALRFQCWSCK